VGSAQERQLDSGVPSLGAKGERASEVLHSECCRIDIHKKSIMVCVLIRESGRKEQKHLREFRTNGSLWVVPFMTNSKIPEVTRA
jgi:hypothetical protein